MDFLLSPISWIQKTVLHRSTTESSEIDLNRHCVYNKVETLTGRKEWAFFKTHGLGITG